MVITQPSHSKTRPFANRTTFDHLNTGLVRYSDGYCNFNSIQECRPPDSTHTKKIIVLSSYLESIAGVTDSPNLAMGLGTEVMFFSNSFLLSLIGSIAGSGVRAEDGEDWNDKSLYVLYHRHVRVVSITLFWFFLVSFSYSGVCFLQFIYLIKIYSTVRIWTKWERNIQM